jgi:hypothetical protein
VGGDPLAGGDRHELLVAPPGAQRRQPVGADDRAEVAQRLVEQDAGGRVRPQLLRLVDEHPHLCLGPLVAEHRRHELGHHGPVVVLGRLQQLEQLVIRERAQLPLLPLQVGRPLGHVHVAGQIASPELAHELPDHHRPHRPAHGGGALEPEQADQRVQVAGVLGDRVSALVCRRLAVAAQVDAHDPEPLGQRVEVALEEPARHRHAVHQQHGPAAAAVVVCQPDASADVEQLGHGWRSYTRPVS